MRSILPLLAGIIQIANSKTGSEFFCNHENRALRISGHRNGTIITRYPDKLYYANYQVCEWIIDSGEDTNRILIEVTSSNLQWTLRNSVCSPHDHVEVREGSSKHSNVLSEWCGEQHPVWLTSTGRYLHITFQSNEFNPNHYTGVSMDFTVYSSIDNACPPGWLQSSSTSEYCYKVYYAYESWVRAQTLCGYVQANLASINSEAEAIFIKDIGGQAFWIGLSDLRHRTKLEWIDRKPLTYNRFAGLLSKDDPACFVDNRGVWLSRDCVLGRYAFICKRRKDGTTIYYPPPDTYTGKGSSAGAFVVPLGAGLLAAVVVMVIVTVLLVICCRQKNRCCWKRKQDQGGDVESRANSRDIALTRLARNSVPLPVSSSSTSRQTEPQSTRTSSGEDSENRGANERNRRHHHNPSGRHHSGGSDKRHRKRHAQPPPAASGPPPYSPRRPPKPASLQAPSGGVSGGVRPGTPPPPYEP